MGGLRGVWGREPMVAAWEGRILVGVGVVRAVGCAVGVDPGMVSLDSCYLL